MGCNLKSVSNWVVKTFRDGDRIGWFAVLGLFSTWMVWMGLIKGLAVMLPALQEQFNASTWLVGWMIAIIDASVEFAAIFASPLRQKFGIRAVVTVSGVLVGGSLIASSFASSLYQMAILLTLFAGPKIGVSNIVTREMIGRHFSKSYTVAYGLGVSGSALVFVTIVPLTQFFFEVYGWRGAMLLLGGILCHLSVCGALMKESSATRSNDEYQTVTVDEEPRVTSDGDTASNSRCRSCLSSVYSFISQTFKLGLLTSTPFWLIIFTMNIWMMMYTAWYIYFVPYVTVSKGFSQEDGSVFMASFGVARLLGNITFGPLVQQVHVISNLVWLGIGLLMLSLYFLIDPWLMSYWPVLIATFTYGYLLSVPVIQFDIVIIDIFGADKMGIVLGWNGLIAGVSRILSLYFPGLIYDILESYTLAFTLMGGVHCFTVVALLALVWQQRRNPSRL